jgi:hypothetical protein
VGQIAGNREVIRRHLLLIAAGKDADAGEKSNT